MAIQCRLQKVINKQEMLIYYMHVPKAGGTSLMTLFNTLLPSSSVCSMVNGWGMHPDPTCASWLNGSTVNVSSGRGFHFWMDPLQWYSHPLLLKDRLYKEQQLSLQMQPLSQCTLLEGAHYSISVAYALRDLQPQLHVRLFTLVRHPVEQALSQYNFMRYCQGALPNPVFFPDLWVLDNSTRIHEWFAVHLSKRYEDIWSVFRLTSYFDGTSRAACGSYFFPSSHSSLPAAIRASEEFEFIGILEDIPNSMKLLQKALGLAKIPSFPQKNVASKQTECAEPVREDTPTERVKALIADHLSRDVVFYEFLLQRFRAKLSQP